MMVSYLSIPPTRTDTFSETHQTGSWQTDPLPSPPRIQERDPQLRFDQGVYRTLWNSVHIVDGLLAGTGRTSHRSKLGRFPGGIEGHRFL